MALDRVAGGGDASGVAELAGVTVGELLDRYPFIVSFFADEDTEGLLDDLEATLERGLLDAGIKVDEQQAGYLDRLGSFIEEMLEFVGEDEQTITSITIRGGRDKDGEPELVQEIEIRAGEVVCIVGPTGSGKSRLLADIEWVAQGDTPTGRQVLLDGQVPDAKWRFSPEHKLVAQLSQNMNFVMDLTVAEFVALHAESRQADDPEALVGKIHAAANELAGEPFALDTPVTSLSGGQSRALMVADTAILSRSPIVLIDEIENAGIDRQRALELLLREEKIVLMATHDPILALSGQRRVVLKNGAMQAVITPTEREQRTAAHLRQVDEQLMGFRTRLRQGELLEDVRIVLDDTTRIDETKREDRDA